MWSSPVGLTALNTRHVVRLWLLLHHVHAGTQSRPGGGRACSPSARGRQRRPVQRDGAAEVVVVGTVPVGGGGVVADVVTGPAPQSGTLKSVLWV